MLLHRDYHPGNVLFEGDAVSGVVDWVETSLGPGRSRTCAHCCANLAMLHGPDTADALPRRLRATAGGTR